jgi:hypothetical protein
MTAGEQTGDSELNRLILAYDNFTNLFREGVNVIGHSEIICGNDSIRKQDMQGADVSSFSSCSNAGFEDVTFSVRVIFAVVFVPAKQTTRPACRSTDPPKYKAW